MEGYNAQLDKDKEGKQQLLSVTKNDEEQFQSLLARLKADAASINAALGNIGAKIGPVNKGDIIYVLTPLKWYRYKVWQIQTVYPSNVSTVAPTKKEVLTLFTCSGFFDEKRLIVKAIPVK